MTSQWWSSPSSNRPHFQRTRTGRQTWVSLLRIVSISQKRATGRLHLHCGTTWSNRWARRDWCEFNHYRLFLYQAHYRPCIPPTPSVLSPLPSYIKRTILLHFRWSKGEDFECPSKDLPYFYTNKNSNSTLRMAIEQESHLPSYLAGQESTHKRDQVKMADKKTNIEGKNSTTVAVVLLVSLVAMTIVVVAALVLKRKKAKYEKLNEQHQRRPASYSSIWAEMFAHHFNFNLCLIYFYSWKK